MITLNIVGMIRVLKPVGLLIDCSLEDLDQGVTAVRSSRFNLWTMDSQLNVTRRLSVNDIHAENPLLDVWAEIHAAYSLDEFPRGGLASDLCQTWTSCDDQGRTSSEDLFRNIPFHASPKNQSRGRHMPLFLVHCQTLAYSKHEA